MSEVERFEATEHHQTCDVIAYQRDITALAHEASLTARIGRDSDTCMKWPRVMIYTPVWPTFTQLHGAYQVSLSTWR